MNGPSSKKYLSRAELIRRRWIAVVFAGIGVSPGGLLLLYLCKNQIDALAKTPGWTALAALAALVLSVFWIRNTPCKAFLGLKHFFTYPPVWVGGLFGASLTWVMLGLVAPVQQAFAVVSPIAVWLGIVGLAGAGGVVALAVTASRIASWRARNLTAPAPLPSLAVAQPLQLSSFEELRKWLEDDAPVESAEHDAFGYQRVAHRIAKRLLADKPPAQAVVGALGAGKTTLRKLVSAALTSGNTASSVRLIPVELWPFETSRAAVQGVIGALLDALADEVSVLELRGLPSVYAEAVSAAGSVGAALVRLQGVPANPISALRRINEIATAIGIRYVVWVEDLERFAGGHPSNTTVETAEEAERLAPIRALLAGLDQLPMITVVTATTTLDKRFDLEKIARYVEVLPELKEEQVGSVLKTFRTGCLDACAVIDPLDVPTYLPRSRSQKARKDLVNFADPAGIAVRSSILGSRLLGIADALAALIQTPRTMKQGLRSCLAIWDTLNGEVDFDDVLAMSIVRVALPDVFSLVERHLRTLRGQTGYSDNDQKAAKEAWTQELHAITEGDARTREIVKIIVKFVFGEHGKPEKPQGLGVAAHTDYWRRFLDVPDLSEIEPDQRILRTILEGDDAKLLDAIINAERSESVEHFSGMLSTERIRSLLIPLVRRFLPTEQESWINGDPPGLIPIWRMWLTRARQGQIDAATVLETIRHAYELSIRTNLALADQLEHWFVSGSSGENDFFTQSPAGRTEAMSFLRGLLVDTHGGNPDTLASALRGAHAPTLLRICWGLDRVRAKDYSGLPFQNWTTFSPTILDAAVKHPRQMLPQLATLVMQESTHVFDNIVHKYTFDPELAGRLFGSADAVLNVFAEVKERFDDTQVLALQRLAAARKNGDESR